MTDANMTITQRETLQSLVNYTFGSNPSLVEMTRISRESPEVYQEFRSRSSIVTNYVNARKRNGELLSITPENFAALYREAEPLSRLRQ